MGLIPPLVEFYGGYGSYHNNTINKAIHMFCIPLLTVTTLIMMLFIDKQFYMQDTAYSVNVATIFIFSLLSLYVYIDFIAGLIAFMFYGTLTFWATNLYYVQMLDSRNILWQYALTVNIVSWIAQFIGHGLFEGRQPALVDNILYTLCAPYFVILEVFFELGYKPDEFRKAKKLIHNNIAQFQQSKKNKKK